MGARGSGADPHNDGNRTTGHRVCPGELEISPLTTPFQEQSCSNTRKDLGQKGGKKELGITSFQSDKFKL